MSRRSRFPDDDRRWDEDNTFAQVLDGFSFGGGQRNRRRKRGQDEHPEPAADQPDGAQHEAEQPPENPVPGRDFPRHAGQLPEQVEPRPGHVDAPRWHAGQRPAQPPQAGPVSGGAARRWSSEPREHPTRYPAQPSVDPDSEPMEAPASGIRSYTWTGGRTRSAHQLELETLVSTSEDYQRSGNLRMEHQSIVELCHHPRSVAEVGALMGLPVGVARVLLADMAELGLVTVHHTVTESGSAPHLMLMERVLSGLRRL